MQKLQGKVAIVTGSTKGIGKAIAKRFMDEGAKVVITSSSQRNVDKAINEFPGQSAFGIACDVSNYDDVEKLISETVARFGRLDVIINNAGVAEPFRRIVDAPLEDWYKPIEINIKGTYHCCRAAIKYFLTVGKGKVINMAGAGTTTNTPYFSGYGSSKAAIYRMTMALAEEYKGTGVEVMLLNPGLVRTEILAIDRPTPEILKRMETFNKVMDMFAQPPSVASDLAVKLSSEWSDGKPGAYLNALSKLKARKLLVAYPFKKMLNKIDRTVY